MELTKTSPAPASDMTLAPTWTAMPRGFSPAGRSTSPVWTPARTSRPSPREGVADGEPAANSTRRPVEERKKAVARGVDLLAVVTIELGSDRRIVPSEELRPRCVTDLRRTLCRADKIGEENGREDAVGRPASAARP